MRKYLLATCMFLVCVTHGQTKLANLENINPADSLRNTSYYKTYIGAFDFIISLRFFNSWGPVGEIALAYNKIGWHKIDINTSRFFRDSSKSEITITKIRSENGDSLFQILKENHLFKMQDERTKKLVCDSFVLFDGPEYEFEIIAKDKYKRLFFYAPEDYYKHCHDIIERKWIIDCIKAFVKYLGK